MHIFRRPAAIRPEDGCAKNMVRVFDIVFATVNKNLSRTCANVQPFFESMLDFIVIARPTLDEPESRVITVRPYHHAIEVYPVRRDNVMRGQNVLWPDEIDIELVCIGVVPWGTGFSWIGTMKPR